MKHIAIISTGYNCQEYVEQALVSVLYQTFPSFLHIITDDGSTDKTPEILKRYADQDDRIIVLRTKHQGAAKAFNNSLRFALENTSCLYIARLDLDDYFLPQALELLYNHISQTKAEMVHADQLDLEKIGDKWYITRCSVTPEEQPTAGQLIRWYNVIAGGSILVNRKFLEGIPSLHKNPDPYWDEEMLGAWEMEWYIRMLIAGARFRKLNLPVYVHRVHEKSLFSESLKGGENSRWLRWRKQLWKRRKKYRELAIQYL